MDWYFDFKPFIDLRRLEKDTLSYLMTESQREYLKKLESEGYEYLFWGYKMSEINEFQKQLIRELGYDPEDSKYIFVNEGQSPDLIKMFFFKKLWVKKSFQVKKQPSKYSKFLDNFKNEIHDFESVEINDLEEYLEKWGFKEGIVSYKYDGMIVLMEYDGEEVRFHSRKGFVYWDIPLCEKLKSNFKLKRIKKCIAIGELYARSDEPPYFLPFSETSDIVKRPDTKEEEDLISFYCYDIVQVNDKKFIKEKNGKIELLVDYDKRVEVIEKVFSETKYFRPLKYKKGGLQSILSMWEKVKKEKGEGIVLWFKDKNEEERWVKIKLVLSFDLAVLGMAEAIDIKGNPKGTLGALLVAFMDEDKNFRFAGWVGTGFDQEMRDKLWDWGKKNKISVIKESEVPSKLRRERSFWVKPKLVVEVGCRGFNVDFNPIIKYKDGEYEVFGEAVSGVLRMGSFVRIREDKSINPKDLRLTQIPNFKEFEKRLSEKKD